MNTYTAKNTKTQIFNPLHTVSGEYFLDKLIEEHALQATLPKHATWPKRFRVDEHNLEPLLKISANFTQDAKALRRFKMKPNKSLLISGATGVGKTHIMKLIRLFMMRHTDLNPFVYEQKVANDIVLGFENKSNSDSFSHPRTRKGELMDLFIDDILSEEVGKGYGGPGVEYMPKVIKQRYPLFTDHSVLTHFTTNGRSQEIEDRYGDKVLERIREMSNIVVFPPKATNWRVFDHDIN